jgi:ketosteroid isomerase-like protein
MRRTILALAAVLAVTPALASDKADVIALVSKYNEDFNKGDIKAMEAMCAPDAFIIDDFAPHAWQGANTCADWVAALFASDKADGITNEAVTLGKPWHVSITGDRGYAVYPTHYSYKRKGKPVTEAGVWTFALQKLAEGWRVKAWAWAQH